jgi:hypothetical protein
MQYWMRTEALHTIERLRYVDASTISYLLTVDAPKSSRLRGRRIFKMKLHPELVQGGLHEFVCEKRDNRCPGGQCGNK